MIKDLLKLAWIIGFVLIAMGSVDASGLTVKEKCAIAKAKATASHVRCHVRALIKGLKKGLSDDEVAQLMGQCDAKHTAKFEKAEAHAEHRGEECASTGDAPDVQGTSRNTAVQGFNTGSGDIGLGNTGDANTGMGNSGDNNTGNVNSGNLN